MGTGNCIKEIDVLEEHKYDDSFGYDDFAKIKDKMPWIVEFAFDENARLLAIRKHDLIKETSQ